MQGSASDRTSNSVVIHPLDPEDAVITAAMRAMVSATKGVARGIEVRGQFDALMESILPRDELTFEADVVGGVPGLWVHPADWQPDEAILQLYGGWFNFGSATAFRHLVGHTAVRAGARAFIPDYRLAPEHPFPAATDDVLVGFSCSPLGSDRVLALAAVRVDPNDVLELLQTVRTGPTPAAVSYPAHRRMNLVIHRR